MNKLNALNAGEMPKIICGQTEVLVKRRVLSDGGRETIQTVHRGIVIQNFSDRFVRVFNPAPLEKGGDTSQENSELFPLDSRMCWCEVTNTRSHAYPIAPALRF